MHRPDYVCVAHQQNLLMLLLRGSGPVEKPSKGSLNSRTVPIEDLRRSGATHRRLRRHRSPLTKQIGKVHVYDAVVRQRAARHIALWVEDDTCQRPEVIPKLYVL